MFDDFEQDVPVGYRIIKNALSGNTLAHAYLIETNNYDKKNEFVLAFAKAIICPFGFTKREKCHNCNICNQIDNNEFLELKVINPNGSMIKKDELSKLQSDFSVKSIIGDKKVYIINDADRMNQMAANSILKFLEEPHDGIFAILTVSSVDKILDTISSRCQIISLHDNTGKKNLYDVLINTMSDEKKIEFISLTEAEKESIIDKIINFVNEIEFNGLSTICFEKSILNLINIKEDLELIFNVIILYYEEIMKYSLNQELKLFPGKYLSDIKKILLKNNYHRLCNKINKVVNLKSNIVVNANINLLIDRLIMNLTR